MSLTATVPLVFGIRIPAGVNTAVVFLTCGTLPPGVAIEFAIRAAAACFLWHFAGKGFTL